MNKNVLVGAALIIVAIAVVLVINTSSASQARESDPQIDIEVIQSAIRLYIAENSQSISDVVAVENCSSGSTEINDHITSLLVPQYITEMPAAADGGNYHVCDQGDGIIDVLEPQ